MIKILTPPHSLSTIDYEEQKRERNALSVDEDEMPF